MAIRAIRVGAIPIASCFPTFRPNPIGYLDRGDCMTHDDCFSCKVDEEAKTRSRIAANVTSFVAILLFTFGLVIVLAALWREFHGMDSQGRIVAAGVAALVTAIWAGWLGIIYSLAVRRRRWFEVLKGSISLDTTSLWLGELHITRSSVVSGKKRWRDLVIRYRVENKIYVAAIPRRWLPSDATDRIIRVIANEGDRKGSETEEGSGDR